MKKMIIYLLVINLINGFVITPMSAFAKHTPEYSDEMLEIARNVLVDLGLWQEFNSNETYLTRAEAAVIACRVLDEYFDFQVNFYKDVPLNHWALNWINTASYNSFGQASYGNYSPFNGDGNGYFHPDDIITYQDFAKVLVVSLGWGPYVEYSQCVPNIYPEEYLKIAELLGLYPLSKDKYEQPLTKDDAIIMVYTALKAPGFELMGFGISFKAYDWLEDRGVVQVRGYAEKLDDNTIIIDKIKLQMKANESIFAEGLVLCFYDKKEKSVIGCYPISSLEFDSCKEVDDELKKLDWWHP